LKRKTTFQIQNKSGKEDGSEKTVSKLEHTIKRNSKSHVFEHNSKKGMYFLSDIFFIK
jgi:hypothetical protein